jgi:hypothetical protein
VWSAEKNFDKGTQGTIQKGRHNLPCGPKNRAAVWLQNAEPLLKFIVRGRGRVN